VVGASRIARDISARKRAAEALRQSEATAQALIESAAEGILIVDDRGRIVLANGMIEEMFGYSERELLGESMERLLPERFRDRHAAHRAGYVAGPRVRAMGQGLDLAARRRDGKEFPVEISLSYVRTPQGMRVMAFVTDITHRLALDQATRQSEKLTALGTLAAGLAHELNNPLGIMISRIELMLLENDQGQLSDAVREDLDVLHRHAQRVSRLVHGLLSFARPSVPERRPIDLNHVVDEILLLAEKQLSRTGIRTTAALDRGLPPVLGDFGALQQVVLNLVTNAYQAMENGGDIRIVTRPAPDMSGWVELLVEDTGPGIPPDVVSKIFDPFYTTKPEGTGLGLSITYRIVHDHDGAVHVDSTPGEGTTFRLRFPAAKPEA
ncbi:MAG: PAS domain S-box protein, partial [Candidatus Rokubacteria bacterium]|nr:PAS domain S-box protein [Candidatus Rokubacteria bacterium]